MAIVGGPLIHARPDIWESGCDNALCSSEPYSTLGMPYQYMTPPSQDSGMDVSQRGYNTAFRVSMQDSSGMEGDGKDSEGSYDEQTSSLGLRRSFSTPNAAQLEQRGSAGSQPQSGGPGEKKRNKLGYHRTSIACSKFCSSSHGSLDTTVC